MKNPNKRAAVKGGKKSTSAQSATAPKIEPGKTQEKTVTLNMVNRAGEHSTLEVSPEMAEQIKASQIIQLGPLKEIEGGGFAGRLMMGAGIHEAIFRYSQRSGIKDFYAAFTKLMQAGLNRAERQDDTWTALSDADHSVQELKLVFDSLRGMMRLWQQDGMPTKERFEDIECGLIEISSRLEKSLEQTIRAIRNAI